MDRIEELAHAFGRFPGIGPRQAKRFVFYLLSAAEAERERLAKLITELHTDVRQCRDCYRFWTPPPRQTSDICTYCSDQSRDSALLLVVEKDQDLASVERAGNYKGRYFVLGGVLTLTGKGTIREQELVRAVELGLKSDLKEIVLALSATSEGEHTTDRKSVV